VLTHYVLDDHGDPQPCDDLLAWAAWFESTQRSGARVIARDRDEHAAPDGVLVSTVFLGLDHQFGSGPPVLWETLVFGGALDGEMRRYTSRAAALAGHQDMCKRVAAAGQKAESKLSGNA
jgi:hypothetical protein